MTSFYTDIGMQNELINECTCRFTYFIMIIIDKVVTGNSSQMHIEHCTAPDTRYPTLAYNFLDNNNRRMNESTNYFNIYSIINATEIC